MLPLRSSCSPIHCLALRSPAEVALPIFIRRGCFPPMQRKAEVSRGDAPASPLTSKTVKCERRRSSLPASDLQRNHQFTHHNPIVGSATRKRQYHWSEPQQRRSLAPSRLLPPKRQEAAGSSGDTPLAPAPLRQRSPVSPAPQMQQQTSGGTPAITTTDIQNSSGCPLPSCSHATPARHPPCTRPRSAY